MSCLNTVKAQTNEMTDSTKLFFIYNAGSGVFSMVSDFAHKIFSPETYPCSLCALTYGNVKMKKEWQDYLDKLPYEKIFLHKDELSEYPELNKIGLPAIVKLSDNNNYDVLLSHQELNSLKNLNQLINKLSNKLD